MTKMKNSGVEWIGEIPDNWEVKPLKALFTFGKGLPITKENLKESGIPVISYGQIHSKTNTGTTIHNNLLRYVDKSYLISNPQSLVQQGDFIFADTSEDLEGCGNCAYVDYDSKLFAGYHTVILKSKNRSNNQYLAYLFKTDEWRKQIRAGLIEVKLYSISRKVLKKASVILPPKSTQQRIASYLDKKCSKIEETIQNQQQVIEKLKAYKQSLITEAITGKIKIQNGKVCGKYESYKDSGVEWIGKIPKGWKVPKVKYLHKGLTDGTHGTYNRLDKGYLLLSSKNVRDNYIEISDNESFISEEDFREITSNGFPQKGDVLLCCIGASIGRCTIYELNEIVAFQRSVIMIRCNEKIVPKFLMYALKSSYVLEQEHVLINQSAQAGLYQGLVSKIYITISSVSEQKEIVDYLEKKCTAIDTAIEQKQKLIEKLTEYKKSLIYECVTGKKAI